MVDSIGARPVTGDRKVAPVPRVASPQPVVAVARPPEETAPPATIAAQLAATPPVDTARVERIKRAITEGKFPLSPATIADRLIALKFEWLSDDAA